MIGLVVVAAGCGREGEPEAADVTVAGRLAPPPGGLFWAPVDVEIADDRVWVLDAGAAQAYGYDRRGRHVLTIGRPGSGPGELKEPLALGVSGDSLWILDSGNGRLAYFDRDGRFLDSQPFADMLPVPVDLVRWGAAFYGAVPFRDSPLVRFGDGASPIRFGSELARRAREMAKVGQRIPSIYRLGVVDDELWAAHLYLPIVGVFDRDGRLRRLLEYPAPEVDATEVGYETRGQEKRWIERAPARPVGGLGFLRAGRKVYLLTHRRTKDRRQVLVSWAPRRTTGRLALGPPEALLVSASGDGRRGFAVGAWGEVEEPAVFVVGPGAENGQSLRCPPSETLRRTLPVRLRSPQSDALTLAILNALRPSLNDLPGLEVGLR